MHQIPREAMEVFAHLKNKKKKADWLYVPRTLYPLVQGRAHAVGSLAVLSLPLSQTLNKHTTTVFLPVVCFCGAPPPQ